LTTWAFVVYYAPSDYIAPPSPALSIRFEGLRAA
jgi:hypothetical protein